MIRWLTIATVTLALLWAGWWFVASTIAGRAVDGIEDNLRNDGWVVNYHDRSTRGFPSRIDMTARDLVVTNPASTITWQMPWLQVFALSYRPNEVILSWPTAQTITLPDQRLTLAADDLMASARAGIASDLPLQNATVQSGLITLTSDAGWRLGAAQMLAALREAPVNTDQDTQQGRYDLYAQLTDLTLPITPGAAMGPDASGMFRFDAQVQLDQPLSSTSAARVEAVSLRDLRFEWGTASMSLSGAVTADPLGRAEGELELELRNWPLLLETAVDLGLIRPQDAGSWQQALAFVSNGDNVLSAPVTLGDGMLLLGGIIPLGPAPRLHR